jgi:hypothetical protein
VYLRILSVFLLLALLASASVAGEGSTKKPAKKRDPAASIKLKKGEKLTFTLHSDNTYPVLSGKFKGRATVLSGSAWVHVKGYYAGRPLDSLLEAENIVVFHGRDKKTKRRTLKVWAEGAVRMTDKDGRLLCSDIYYDFVTHRGRARGVRLEIGKVKEVAAKAGSSELSPGSLGSRLKMSGGQEGAGGTFGSVEDAWSIGFGKGAPKKWYVSAPEIRRAGPGKWVIIKPRISNCSFEEPHWCFQASSANYLPGRRVESFNNVLKIGKIPIFYLPYIARDLAHDYPWTQWHFGNSNNWGPYALSKWGLDLPSGEDWIIKPRNLYFDVDWRRERGFAYGVGLRYEAMPHGGGLFDSYFMREDHISRADDLDRAEDDIERRAIIYENLRSYGAPKIRGRPKRIYGENLLFFDRRHLDSFNRPDLDEQLYSREERFRLVLHHRQDMLRMRNDLQQDPVYKLDLSVEYQDYSDRDFQREYFRDEYRYGPSPVSYVMLRNQSDAMTAAVVVQPRVDHFFDQTEYLPELRVDVPQRALPGGFFLAWDGSVGRLKRRFDEDSGFENLDAGRAHLRLVGSRPIHLGRLAINPYVGTDQTWYSDHFRGAEVIRGALLYGAESSVRFYGLFNFESENYNIHGLRHVIEPRVRFDGVSSPTHRTWELYDFDRRDDLFQQNVARAGLYQKLQVRRRDSKGGLRTVDYLGVDFVAAGFADHDEADKYNHGDMLLPFVLRGFFNPSTRLSLWGKLDIDAHGVGLARSSTGASYSQDDRFALSLSHTVTAEDPGRDIAGSSYLSARADVALGPLYRVAVGTRYEFDHPDEDLGEQGLDNLRVELVRNLHCWRLGIGYSTERRDDEINRAFTLTVSPTGRSRNLVKGSDQLILDDPDYSRMPWRAYPGEAAGALRLLPPDEPPPPPQEEEGEDDDEDQPEPPGAE